jgi:nitrogen-specific signal transduction histidine kinase
VSKRCNYINQHEHDVKNTSTSLLNNLQTGVLMLDGPGHIILANPTACEWLNMSEGELLNKQFTSLCISGEPINQEMYGTSTYLTRSGGPPLPISYRTAQIELPATARPDDSPTAGETELTLLTFTDISRPLQLEQQLEQVERITAATRIAGEMAHEIRTPLTSISASIQLLQHYEEKSTAADWLPNSPRRKDRVELFDHIMTASEQMDSVIKNFVDFAEFSPADLLSIIKLDSIDENRGYIGHLNTIAKGFENGQDSNSG